VAACGNRSWYGTLSVGTLRNWEQGRRYPEGPARALLKIAAENPEVFEKALV